MSSGTPCPRTSGSRPPKEKRRSRLWLWISLAVLAVTVAAVVLAAILGGSSGSGQHRPLPGGGGDNPSSIVDIFRQQGHQHPPDSGRPRRPPGLPGPPGPAPDGPGGICQGEPLRGHRGVRAVGGGLHRHRRHHDLRRVYHHQRPCDLRRQELLGGPGHRRHL